MADIFNLTLVFLLMLLLLRKKWNVGVVLILASAVLFLVYSASLATIGKVFRATVVSDTTWQLLIALTFIRMMEMVLREKKVLKQMMDSVKALLRNKKFVVVSMPLLIGMLPSIGGAYFSCPMVDEATEGLDLNREEKAFLNYWYRHPWELFLPLYPGIVLAIVLSGTGWKTYLPVNGACALLMLAVGVFFGMKKVKGVFHGQVKRFSPRTLWSFAPLTLLLLLVVAGGVQLSYALVATVTVLLLFFRYPLKGVVEVVKYGFSRDVILLIAGIMLFKETIEGVGAVAGLAGFLTGHHIPLVPLLLLLPLITGLLTGFTVGVIGITFPILAALPGISPYAFPLAFVAGYAGVMLSPVHVCFILTLDYFKADMWKVYRMTIPATVCLFLLAFLEFAVFTR